MSDNDEDDEMQLIAHEVTWGDPGHLGEDEPELQPLCRECVRELPDDADGLCGFCRVVTP